MTSLDRHS